MKRSIIGTTCKLGNSVKIVSSILMADVIVEEGCHIQNSIVCNGSHLQVHDGLLHVGMCCCLHRRDEDLECGCMLIVCEFLCCLSSIVYTTQRWNSMSADTSYDAVHAGPVLSPGLQDWA